jgi:hypothetical protein
MKILEFTLACGSKISINSTDISCVCEIRKDIKKKTDSGASIKASFDDPGWDVRESYDTVIKAWEDTMEKIVEVDLPDEV